MVGVWLGPLVTAVSSSAQDFRGRINGTVTDNTGAVLPGVTVTTTSPALIQPQVQVTGEDGDVSIPRTAARCLRGGLRAHPDSKPSNAKTFASSSTPP